MAHWIIDTTSGGSVIVAIVALSVLTAYGLMLRWILTAPKPEPGKPQGETKTGGKRA